MIFKIKCNKVFIPPGGMPLAEVIPSGKNVKADPSVGIGF